MKRCCINPNNYYYGLAAFSESRVDPFSIFLPAKQVLHTSLPTNHSQIEYLSFVVETNLNLGSPGGITYLFFMFFLLRRPLTSKVSPGIPRVPPGMLFYIFCVIDLCTLGCPRVPPRTVSLTIWDRLESNLRGGGGLAQPSGYICAYISNASVFLYLADFGRTKTNLRIGWPGRQNVCTLRKSHLHP